MSEVGALVIRLQAETAQFREDLGKVKGDLKDLQDPAAAAGNSLNYSFTSARGSMMLVENVAGVRLPRALNTLIAGIPAVGTAFSMMLPLVGVIAAIAIITRLIEKHDEMKSKAEATRAAWVSFSAGAAESMRGLEDGLLRAGIKADELKGDHLGALAKELKIIDNQTLNKLIGEFDKLADHADKVFADMRAEESFFQFGSSAKELQTASKEYKDSMDMAFNNPNAKASLEEQKEATNKFRNVINQTALSLDRMREINKEGIAGTGIKGGREETDVMKEMAAGIKLATEELRDFAGMKKVVAETAGIEKDNAHTEAYNKVATDQAAVQKIVQERTDALSASMRKLAQIQAETALSSDKGNGDESIDARLEKEKAAYEQQRQLDVNAAKAALDSDKTTYDQSMKLAGEDAQKKKVATEIWTSAVLKAAELIIQVNAEANQKTVAATAAAEAEKARIVKAGAQAAADGELKAAIDGAARKEKYEMEAAKDLEALGKRSAQQTADAEKTAVNNQLITDVAALQKRIDALDKYATDYRKKLADFNAKIKEDIQKAADERYQIQHQADQKQLQDIRAAYDQMQDAIASTVSKSIMEGKNMGQAFEKVGAQMLESALTHLLEFETVSGRKRLVDAKQAASDAYAWAGNPILGAVLAAAAFTSVMAFEQGGKIPGDGAVPIIGHGGETVVTKALTDRVERSEGTSGGGDLHMHNTFAPQINALDSEGVDRVLAKHQTTFQRHITSAIRRMNK
jgi:hypothetical protein